MKKEYDLTGKRFGSLVVLGLPETGYEGKKTKWVCKCDCGNILTKLRRSLTHANNKKCVKCDGNTYEIKEDHVIVYDYNKNSFIIDLDDLERVKEHRWIFHNRYIKRNVSRTIKKGPRMEYLHRFLMKPPEDMFVDHIDRNPLNNRKSNLRVCTRSENAKNFERKETLKSTSRYKGVRLDKGRMWRATIYCDGITYNLGRFKTEVEAAKAYNKKALELRGEFANINEV